MIYINILVCITMFWAGIGDFRTRIVKDRYTIIMFVLVAIRLVYYDMSPLSALLGGLIVFVPFLVVALIKGGIGGADIKLTTALGCFLGFSDIFVVVILSYVLLFIFAGILKLVKKQKLTHIPYICFLTGALYGYYFITLFI